MKIRIVILDDNAEYLQRLLGVFVNNYSTEIEARVFTDPDKAMELVKGRRMDAFIAGMDFEIDKSQIPDKCAFAYLVDNSGIESFKGERAIFRFQKVELIYKQILSAYSDQNGDINAKIMGNGRSNLMIFCSPGGGTGTSTLAVACARKAAARGFKPLYIDMNAFGSVNCFFSSDGGSSVTDLIYALKSNKANLQLKLESFVRRDASGVFFYSDSTLSADRAELTSEELLTLVKEIVISGAYDIIVLDYQIDHGRNTYHIFDQADAVIMVSDGSEISNYKLKRCLDSLKIQEQYEIMDKTKLAYNRFNNQSGKYLDETGVESICVIPALPISGALDVVNRIAGMPLLDKIIDL